MGKSNYKLAAVVAWGNLFIASQRKFTLDDINGAEITMFGEKTINSSITKFVLAENGIKPANIEYLAGAKYTEIAVIRCASIVLTAEPALTARRTKNDRITAYSVNELYKAATGHDGFTQAGLLLKRKL